MLFYQDQKIYLKTLFCNILNVYTVTFDQFSPFLLSKSIAFFKKGKKEDKKEHLLLGNNMRMQQTHR